MDITQWPDGMLAEIESLSRDDTKEMWHQFLRLDGIAIFRELLQQIVDYEQIEFDLNVKTAAGEKVPDGTVILVIMRAAIKTISLGAAIERWMHEHQSEVGM